MPDSGSGLADIWPTLADAGSSEPRFRGTGVWNPCRRHRRSRRAAALRLVDNLGLDGYHLFHAIRGDLLARLGRAADARQAFQAAAQLTQNQREHDYLRARCDALNPPE